MLPTQLVGRERETADAVALLRGRDVRLLTFTGPGGIGKTRLALHVAAAVLDHFVGGVFVVDLAALTDPAQVEPAIARALALAGLVVPDPGASVAVALRDAPVLLLLDNCEHLPPVAALVAVQLAACPPLTILATSRAALRLRDEHRFPVPPLGLPDPACAPQVASVSHCEAVRLFVARARAVAPDFALSDANAAAVAAICRRLDGLPLAIEMAAARVEILSPRALLARLEGSEGPQTHRHAPLRVLVGGAADLPARQRTLGATIAWSHDLLDDVAHVLFRRLAIFAGDWTLDAAERICPSADGDWEGEPDEALDVLEGVARLASHSLVRAHAHADAAEPRFDMLNTIRAYALERLAASGEEATLRQRHAVYYCVLAEAAEPGLTGPEGPASLARLDEEGDNLRAALLWARDDGETALGLRLATALWRYWHIRGYLGEGRAWFDAFLRGTMTEGSGSALRAGALNGAGVLAAAQGDYGCAVALFEECLSLRRAGGDGAGISATLSNLGLVAMEQGDYGRAVALFEEDLAVQRGGSDRWSIAAIMGNLAELARLQGQTGRAIRWGEESVALYRAVGDRRGAAISTQTLAGAVAVRGEYARAWTLYDDCLGLWRLLGDRRSLAECLEALGSLLSTRGDGDGAAELFDDATRLRAEIGCPISPADRALYAAHLACPIATGVVEDMSSLEVCDASDRPRDTEKELAKGGDRQGIGQAMVTT